MPWEWEDEMGVKKDTLIISDIPDKMDLTKERSEIWSTLGGLVYVFYSEHISVYDMYVDVKGNWKFCEKELKVVVLLYSTVLLHHII